ncbi:MAG: PIG-L family deacetylase [Anaerovoracaceae bacterium]
MKRKEDTTKEKMKLTMKSRRTISLLLIILCFAFLFPIQQAEAYSKPDESEDNKTIMVFAPHQDDEALMANPIMYSHAKRGDDVYVVMGFGSDPKENTNDSYGRNRLRESKKNLEKLGISADHLIYLGYQKLDYAIDEYKDKDTGKPIKPFVLGSDGELCHLNGNSYYTYSHVDEGFPSYHFYKHNEECKASEENMISDIAEVIMEYKPDELYVVNYDKHIEHMWLGSMVDQAFGVVKHKEGFENYCPRYYQSMGYQSNGAAPMDMLKTPSPNDGNRLFLESTIPFTPRNPTFSWEDRVRFSVEDEMAIPDFYRNVSAQAFWYGFGTRVYADNTTILLGSVNSDQIFWERDTRNLAYQASSVNVTSNPQDSKKINDFSTLRMPLATILELNVSKDLKISKDLNFSDYKWSPAEDDESRTVTLNFEQPQNISSVKLYDDYRTENQIKAGVLTFKDSSNIESSINVGPLDNGGGANTILFETKTDITSVSFQITDYAGTPGLTEFEVYAPNSPRKTDYIQIYLDKVNGVDWKNKSFLYDYPVDVTSKAQVMQLGAYCYPNEAAPSSYNWGLSGGAKGITLTQNGLLTVTPEAESGSYQIQVTSKDDANLTDVMTIQVKGKNPITWDINMDGHCDYRDLAYVLMGLDGFYKDCADVNGDGVIDTKDVSLVWGHIKLENQ